MPVYFVINRPAAAIKIGHSGDIHKRLAALQTGCPDLLEVLATMEGAKPEEERLHDRFAKWAGIGEWFQATPELLDFIDENAISCEPLPPSPEFNAYIGLIHEIDRLGIGAFVRGCGRHDGNSNVFFWLRKARGEQQAERTREQVEEYARTAFPDHALAIIGRLQDRFAESY